MKRKYRKLADVSRETEYLGSPEGGSFFLREKRSDHGRCGKDVDRMGRMDRMGKMGKMGRMDRMGRMGKMGKGIWKGGGIGE